jgi:hypothetical protein
MRSPINATHNARAQAQPPLSASLGATPATAYQVGFEHYAYTRQWDCPWRPNTPAARDYAAGLLDAQRAERAGVL